ncbi:hypothetical protein XA68_11493 [Ophiocordyceps unilateralis]|uniref:NACHT domain-containing protein n=1 Tax=Ophiocordyceps unilateralis TaxID=268505 RepID=A0A2A9PF05_OPHUN|nr:hypothetical protein XA68_11493 [Ophiocordyceps unilateralis]
MKFLKKFRLRRSKGNDSAASNNIHPRQQLDAPADASPVLIGKQTRDTSSSEEQRTNSLPASINSHTPVRELWNMAYENLREESEGLVKNYEAKLGAVLSVDLDSTRKSRDGLRDWMDKILQCKMEEINRDTWKLKFKSSEVQVRDLVKPVLAVVHRANGYITKATSGSPYASMAWAGRLTAGPILQLLSNPSEQGASLAEGLEHISYLISQSRIWEDLYERRYESHSRRDESSPTSHDTYKNSLERLYREILRFQVTGYCYCSHNATSRLSLDFIKWHGWTSMLAEIKRKEDGFTAIKSDWRDKIYDDECSVAQSRHQKAIFHWQNIGTDVSGLLEAIKDAQEEKKRDGFIDWLCEIDPSSMYNTARDKHESGTGNWLLIGNEKFDAWLRLPRSLLWLHGKAGCGKLILSSSVIDYLRDLYAPNPMVAVAYFFFSFNDKEKQNVDGMLASLIKQLYTQRPDTPEPVSSLSKYKRRGERPDSKMLQAALLATMKGFSAVFIIIDALDECPTRNEERKKLLDSLVHVFNEMPDSVHIFCTSRPELDIGAELTEILALPSTAAVDLSKDQHGLNDDIELYIDSVLKRARFSSWPDTIKEKTKDSLINKADGMFQYVFLQLELLGHLSNGAAIKQALGELPDGLDATYTRLLENTDVKIGDRLLSLLKWLAFAKYELSIQELAEVFILRPEREVPCKRDDRLFRPRDVLKYLASLVVTWRDGYYGDTRVRLAHFSVKEFLTSGRVGRFSFTESDAHMHIGRSCLVYHLYSCRLNDIVEFEELDRAMGAEETEQLGSVAINEETECLNLRGYAVLWAEHLEMVPCRSWQADVVDDALRALSIRSESVRRMIERYDCFEEKISPLQRPPRLMARMGFAGLTEMLLRQSKYLIQEDLDVALQEAVVGGSEAVFRLLLDRGADVDAENAVIDGGMPLEGPLWAAAYQGLTVIVKQLLDEGIDVNRQYGELGSALQAAALQHYSHVMQLLVARGARIDLSSEAGCALTSVVSTVRVGFPGVDASSTECIQFLLDRGVDVNMQGGSHGTALTRTAEYLPDTLCLFHLLLDKGADVNARGGHYGSPLQAVCAAKWEGDWVDEVTRSRYKRELVELLLDKGADVNARGGYYDTPLQAAACLATDHDRDLVELLLAWGADANAQGGRYGTALQAACVVLDGYYCESARDVVELLLDRGADVNIQGGEYGNALQAACFYHNDDADIAGLLIEHGADVNALGGRFGTSLQAAAAAVSLDEQQGCCQVYQLMELLLGRGVNVNQQGGEFGTALNAACARKYSSWTSNECRVQLLLDHGADVHAVAGPYGSPLQAAFTKDGHECLIICRMLLEHGADVNMTSGIHGSAWNTATTICREDWSSVIDAMKLLLAHGVDVNSVSSQHGTALEAFLCHGIPDSNMTRFLLDNGADVNLGAGEYGFPLQSACASPVLYRTDLSIRECSQIDNITFLLDSCPYLDVNASGGKFGSALQAAAFTGRPWAVRKLLDRGADVNARKGKYTSPLNAAVLQGHWDIVDLLQSRGARPECELLPEPDEAWLASVCEDVGRGAVERYQKFWDVESAKGA